MNTLLFTFSAVFVLSQGKKLPSYIKPCSMNDPDLNKCAKESALQAIPNILKGDRSFGNPKLVPLHLDLIEINPSDRLSIKLMNITLNGLETNKLNDLRIDPQRRHVMAKLNFKKINLDCQYNINGKILLLNIQGNGPANLTFDDVDVTYSVEYELITKDNGKQYIDRNLKAKVNYTIGTPYYQFNNLFNGSPEIGEQINKFLNENRSAIGEDLGDTISETIGAIVTNILRIILTNVPYVEIFP